MNEIPKRPSPQSVWTAPFLRTEWAMEWTAYTLSRLAIVQVLEYAGRFAVIVAVILFFTESEERARNARYVAWEVINSAQGQPGSGARFDAMQYLASKRAPMVGLSAPGAILQYIDLHGAKLRVADLSNANLGAANLTLADLSGANLRGADLLGANLPGAYLISADLRGADLRAADLNRANLRGANLAKTDLRGADLLFAKLRGALLILTNFRDAFGLSADEIRSIPTWRNACYDEQFRKKLGIKEDPPGCVELWGEVQPLPIPD